MERASKRIPTSIEANLIRGGRTYKAVIVGMSENGLYAIAESEARELIADGVGTLTAKFNTSTGQAFELECKLAWSNKQASRQSLQKIGLEISNPPAEFKKFYRSTFYRVKKEISHDAIAVIGMACYYPGAPDLKAFWENILARRRAFRRLPSLRLPLSEYYDPDPFAPDKTYADRAAVIDGFEFDWVKRGIPKSVVESSDIVHWLALEQALRALEDAGYARENIPTDRTGVILGNTMTGDNSRSQQMRLRWPYVKKVLKASALQQKMPPDALDELIDTMEVRYKSSFAEVTEDTLAGNLSNTIAGRICNFLDLHGGGYTVDGACSSSLIAVATAADALSTGTLDLAIAGGIDISLDSFELIGFAKTNALAKDDMRVYDRRANGFIPGEGVGLVVLKRLQDARKHGNYVYATMRGWGISSDGKGGMTAPKAKTQALAIRRAYGKAGYGLESVDFIEGHGTGTMAGDKAELEGIADAMGDGYIDFIRPCGITSLKSLIGHTKAASGVGGFIKAVMAVNRRVVPPTAGCTDPNPVFEEKAHGLYPVLEGEVRSADDSMRAGVSGMGFGGINCHVTIESAGEPAKRLRPSIDERELIASYQETELFVVAAGSSHEMLERMERLKDAATGISVGEMVDLSKDLAENLSEDAPFRAAMIAGNPEGLVDCLNRALLMLRGNDIPRGGMISDPHQDVWIGNAVSRARVGFLFPGQGSQQLNMGRMIVERLSWARQFREQADTWLKEAGYEGVGEFIYRPLDRALDSGQIDGWKAELSRTSIAQPAICMTSLLWMRRLKSLGITPVVAGGHSLGELTAFHTAGAFDEKSLIHFAAFRGRVTSADDGNTGIMASIGCGRDKVDELLKDVDGYAVVANVNGPGQTVISGERAAVEKAVGLASMREVRTKILPVTNAFHSRFMSAAAEALLTHAPVPETLGETTVRLLSSMDGGEVKPGTDIRRHFAGQATHPVDFSALVNNIANECDLLVEVGPGRVLSDLVKSIKGSDGTACLPIEARAGDDRSLNVFLGCYFVRGGRINWPYLFENRLARPFVPASKRSFIENPCERSSAVDGEEIEALRSVVVPITEPAMSSPPAFEDETVMFSKQQVDYIRRLIHAETLGLRTETKGQAGVKVTGASKARPSAAGGIVEPGRAAGQAQGPEKLIELASEMTGFPKESISLDRRLLDDLNLDSIKAGQFVARAVKLYGAETKQLDPTSMANSSLVDIYELLKNDRPSAQPLDEMTARRPGAGPVEAPSSVSPDNWVRDFKVVYVEEPRISPDSFQQIVAAVAEAKRHVLIVSDDETDRLSSGMQNILAENGVAATSMDYVSLGNRTPGDCGRYDYFVFLLPRTRGADLPVGSQVLEMATRMHCIGKVITSLKDQVPKPTYAVVQFGDGGFHTPDVRVSMEAKGSSAFLCSLHLENPDERIRILEFSDTDDARRILSKIAEELHASDGFCTAVYDGSFARRVPALEPARPGTFKKRAISWTPDDVVLVTGGAKGITAECALAFAVKNRVKLALVGSTVLVDVDEEVQKSFSRYRDKGVVYRYYACDVADKESVADLLRRVGRDLGPVTGVVHGAAINKPRRFELSTLEEAKTEIAPKLWGAINILECLNHPPKLFVGFGSIIGVTGMAGNTWYAFANETLNLLLQRFKADTKAEVITPAFSVWDEVGMGTRLGTIGFLSRIGIHTIPKDKGVEHFMRLLEMDPGEEQVVVSSRLGNLDIIRRSAAPGPHAGRFLENVLLYEKGVEIRASAVLDVGNDPYLNDHVFRGTCLFPTVFGIEAMAQAVSAVTGTPDIGYLRLEDIQLKLPITVEPGGTTEIRIQALVDEATGEDSSVRVKAGIAVAQTNFTINHFEATFVLGMEKELEAFGGEVPQSFLDVVPEEDVYGHMLFQGKTFQRIKAVRSLDDTSCVFDAVMDAPDAGLLTKDPYFRDTLLQSAQLILPDLRALPVGIDSWDILLEDRGPGPCTVAVDSLKRDKEFVTADVYALDAMGRVIERLHGYKAKIIERVQDAPGVNDLADPDDWDEARLNGKLQRYCRELGVTAPEVSLKHHSGLHRMKKTARHALEKDLFERSYARLRTAFEGLPDEITISWTRDGKPFAKGTDMVGLSCSHDDRLCLCAAGRGTQGLDVEAMTDRTAEEWKGMLGSARSSLLEVVAGTDKSADMAGSRIWCALEAARKATGASDCELSYSGRMDTCVTFTCGGITVITFPVKFLRGRQRMVAVAAAQHETAGLDATYDTENSPKGQKVFRHQFTLGLRDSATVGGGVYFASYFHWLGKAREMALRPIGRYIADEFYNGHFMVTNFTETNISGHVENHEVMDTQVWIENVFDGGSSLMLNFEWLKTMPDGKKKRVAFSRHHVSWIRTVDQGVVEPVPSPPFFAGFLRDKGFLPEQDGSAGEYAGDLERHYPGLGEVIQEGSILGDGGGVLEEGVIDTTMEHSNLAQNIYFSNYFTWQGQLRDRYIFNLSPGQYRKMGREGQFVCVHAHIKHLREAMPFDRILVTMQLGRVYERGILLYYEYFKVEPDGSKIKLAYGDHVLAWARVDSSDDFIPEKIPEAYMMKIINPAR